MSQVSQYLKIAAMVIAGATVCMAECNKPSTQPKAEETTEPKAEPKAEETTGPKAE